MSSKTKAATDPKRAGAEPLGLLDSGPILSVSEPTIDLDTWIDAVARIVARRSSPAAGEANECEPSDT